MAVVLNNNKRRNFFVSYHHHSNFNFLNDLREILHDRSLRDYGFKELDLGESSKYGISRYIQYRIWSSSITVVLVGDQTGESDWIDWEIWYSLRNISAHGSAKRVFKPKGIVALFLPVDFHNVPKRLQANLDSGYALRLNWEDLDKDFYACLERAYLNRKNVHLIKNGRIPKINPQSYFSRFLNWF
ncbi:TIR domain-containing protein [Algoriphagus sp. D3-2-R+10]|uniref:TIR domain-containing protein n=1 Tax=Algoriphagus aurantiacus TaxID=3103948 RepID=UPI002B377534|nr:TIR domain-containing protein [Algoriphagus sp. D3-2-R+10]MEB2777472.1 TIR domain-containing protein [Algoriphagus sp. D3-2-R+10]